MTYFKTAFAATTALTLSMGAAYADSNTLFLDQTGSDNDATIHQSGTASHPSAGGNDIGLSGAPVLQNGDGNFLSYTNSGYASGSDNDIVKLEQNGNENWFQARDSNQATGNRINDVQQDGNINQALVVRAGETGSVVEQIVMDGNSNVLVIDQGKAATGGGSNTVTLAKIVGNGNGNTNTTAAYRGAYPGQAGVYVVQKGSTGNPAIGNVVQEASIEGDDNRNFSGWGGNAVSVIQNGSYNGTGFSIARMIGSDGNKIAVQQTGDGNNFAVYQGTVTSDTGNVALVDQIGDGNGVTIDQDGSYNSTTASFTGNDNGVGTMNGVAGNLESSSLFLSQGNIFQDSSLALSGNTVSYVVTGNSNLFAFAQIGGGNTIDGQVGTIGSSNGNQVAVLQNGSGNGTTFTQNGGGNNNLAVSQ